MTTSRFLTRRILTCFAGLLVWAGAHVMPAAAQAPRGAGATSLAARVQHMDVEEIRTLLLDYGRSLDTRDLVTYSRLFAKDGEWVGGFGTVQGAAAIQAFMEKNIGTAPNRNRNYHQLTNFVIDVQGDKAAAWSRWAFVVPGADGKTALAQAGRYDDVLVRENGRWQFLRRVASRDLPVPAPAPTQ